MELFGGGGGVGGERETFALTLVERLSIAVCRVASDKLRVRGTERDVTRRDG